jgi:hypothetical protein
MKSRWLLLFLLSGVMAAAPSDAETLELNRRLLEKWRGDPEHYERLLHDLHAFAELPPERQERMRKFDRRLHALDDKTRARLWGVLDRYRTWLEHLPEDERRKIMQAAPEERLRLIRELRTQQWVDRLPVKLREEVLKQPEDRRAKFVAELRKQERAQRVVWMKLEPSKPKPRPEPEPAPEEKPKPKPKPSGPARFADFTPEVQRFIRDHLRQRLTLAEKEKLAATEGKWPEFPRLVRELADRHPVLPPLPSGEITSFEKLPALARNFVKPSSFKLVQGRWPEYALAVSRHLKRERKGQSIPPLGASKLKDFPEEVRTFVRDKLLPALSAEQKKDLHKLEGHWPEYPKRLLELARQKRLVIPGMSLPGPSEWWEGRQVGR